MPCCKKIQGTYFKIQGTYFKIYALYFSSFQTSETQQLTKTTFLTSKIVFGDIRKNPFLQKSARQADMSFNSTHRGITKNSVSMFFRQIRRN